MEQTDGTQQKTEKSISHSSSHGGRVFEFPLPAAAYIPISGSVSDGAASPAIGSISRKTAANLLPRAHDRRSHRYDRGRGADFAEHFSGRSAGSRGTAFHGGAGTLFRRASRTDGGIVTARTAI